MLAGLILSVHLAIIAFNLFGLVVIPIGTWRGWRFIYAPAWRILHIVLLSAVALQATLGRACFLTIWQNAAEGRSGTNTPLIMHWVNAIIYWPLPMWVFTVIYLCVFAYALALLLLVPPHWRRRPAVE